LTKIVSTYDYWPGPHGKIKVDSKFSYGL